MFLWYPRAIMSPFGVIWASNGGWVHLDRSGTGTTSVWEFNMMDGKSGWEPGNDMTTIGLFLTH